MSDYAARILAAYDAPARSAQASRGLPVEGVSLELAELVTQVALAVEADPGFLADLINYETAGTWSPAIQNPNSSATGLIQFIESTAGRLGTTTAALAGMTAVQQMAFVHIYFDAVYQTHGPLSAESDLYMAVFYPAAIGKGLDYAFGAAVTAVNASNTTRDYVEAVRRKSQLGRLLLSSTGSGAQLAGLGVLLLAAVAVSV